ncbi:Pr6Pr family membrane protein [Mucilaginibacter sp. L196]|uniref:Pr6Pr family membrane protein n=1 Tax=Mucilaginibacter sp. L196 TaxID=1641870 RepID=UPI00131DA057|nr:Pr6Pr family membrane protein [Mucilaginibacter sp. L196]
MIDGKSKKIFLGIIALTGVIAIILQLYATIINRVIPIGATLIKYFSFFTIQTNILVTACVIFALFNLKSSWGRFFSRISVVSALTVYIIIVSLIYNLILRQIWNPQGLQKFGDELLHVVMPALFILYWIFCTSKLNLKWNVGLWLVYPLIYAVYVIIRGTLTGDYSYPFMDAGSLGYAKVFLNIGGLVIVFLGFSLLLVALGKLLAKTENNRVNSPLLK